MRRDADTLIDGCGAIVLCAFLLVTFVLSYSMTVPVATVIEAQVVSP